MFSFRKSKPDRQGPEPPTSRHRGIKRSLMFFGLLAAVNLAVALFNVWLGLLVSFAFGPAYIITAIVLAVFAFTETAAVPQNGAAEPSTASDNKRRKVRRTFVVVALLLLIAVPVFLFLLSSALSHTDFR